MRSVSLLLLAALGSLLAASPTHNRNSSEVVVRDCGGAVREEEGGGDFPSDLFSQEERKHGAIVLHLLCGLYCFIIIAFVCNDYFLPSVDCICQDLNLSKDVAGATFMAFATSAPELFVNVIGTFLTESDLGVGTVVGSAVCNTLGVPACAGLAALSAIKLEVWPLVRDCGIYMVVVAALTGILWDEKVYWYEATALLLLYVLYLFILFCQRRLHTAAKTIIKTSSSGLFKVNSDLEGNKGSERSETGSYRAFHHQHPEWVAHVERRPSIQKPPPSPQPIKEIEEVENDDGWEVWHLPEGSWIVRTWYLMCWPVIFGLYITVPDCKKRRNLYPLTFILCIFWIGASSYLVSWMMTVLGQTFGISDSVMGLTLVAIGGSMPEASSSIINARLGIGSMSISNALGGNTLDILLSLGLPWLIKTQVSGPVVIRSVGLVYNNAAQLACVAALFLATAGNSFRLDRKLGAVCLVLYLLFIFFIVALELDLFKIDSPAACS